MRGRWGSEGEMGEGWSSEREKGRRMNGETRVCVFVCIQALGSNTSQLVLDTPQKPEEPPRAPSHCSPASGSFTVDFAKFSSVAP